MESKHNPTFVSLAGQIGVTLDQHQRNVFNLQFNDNLLVSVSLDNSEEYLLILAGILDISIFFGQVRTHIIQAVLKMNNSLLSERSFYMGLDGLRVVGISRYALESLSAEQLSASIQYTEKQARTHRELFNLIVASHGFNPQTTGRE